MRRLSKFINPTLGFVVWMYLLFQVIALDSRTRAIQQTVNALVSVQADALNSALENLRRERDLKDEQ